MRGLSVTTTQRATRRRGPGERGRVPRLRQEGTTKKRLVVAAQTNVLSNKSRGQKDIVGGHLSLAQRTSELASEVGDASEAHSGKRVPREALALRTCHFAPADPGPSVLPGWSTCARAEGPLLLPCVHPPGRRLRDTRHYGRHKRPQHRHGRRTARRLRNGRVLRSSSVGALRSRTTARS